MFSVAPCFKKVVADALSLGLRSVSCLDNNACPKKCGWDRELPALNHMKWAGSLAVLVNDRLGSLSHVQ